MLNKTSSYQLLLLWLHSSAQHLLPHDLRLSNIRNKVNICLQDFYTLPINTTYSKLPTQRKLLFTVRSGQCHKSHFTHPLRLLGRDNYMQLVIEHVSYVMLCLHSYSIATACECWSCESIGTTSMSRVVGVDFTCALK